MTCCIRQRRICLTYTKNCYQYFITSVTSQHQVVATEDYVSPSSCLDKERDEQQKLAQLEVRDNHITNSHSLSHDP